MRSCVWNHSPLRRIRVLLLGLAWLCGATLAPGSEGRAAESHHVLVMIVDFADESAPPNLVYQDGNFHTVALNVANAESVFFTGPASTAARYAEMSQGDLTLTGEVIAVSLAENLGDVTVSEWRADADAAAVSQGQTLSDYDRFGYLFRYGFSGQTSAGGAPGNADFFWASTSTSSLSENMFGHELGHTLGLRHAATIASGGSTSEYGDQSDFMGSGNASHTNAVNKDRKSWLPGNRRLDFPLDGANTYTLDGLAESSDSLQVVVVDTHGALAQLGVPVDTFVSYRPPTNFDQNLAVATDPYGTPLRDTVHVHQARKDGTAFSYLVRALEEGDSYSTNGTTIEVLDISPAGAEIDVSQAVYLPGAPLVSVDPVDTNQVLANTTVEYDVSVTNTDPAGVTFPAYYANSFTTPGAGWNVHWDTDPMHILVTQGDTQVFGGLHVTSPLGAAPGIYAVELTLTNETGSAGPVATVANAIYEVLPPPDTTPPPPPSGLRGDVYPGTGDDYIVLQWDAPADTSDVYGYQVYRNGAALPPQSGTQTFYLDFLFSGLETNVYVVRSVDAAGNESVSSDPLVAGLPDSEPPTAPSALTGTILSWNEIRLDWGASSDNVGVVSYEIYRDGGFYASTSDPWFIDTAPQNHSQSYSVYALDAEGNTSLVSNSWQVDLTLPALSPPGLVLLVALLIAAALRAARAQRPPSTPIA